jgi:hypothetical protein
MVRRHWARTRAGSTSTAFEDATFGSLGVLSASLTAAECTDAAVDRFDAAIATVRRDDAAPYLPQDENASEAATITAVIAAWHGSFSQSSRVTTARNSH